MEPSTRAPLPTFTIGQKLVVTVEKIAHGGHFIARHGGAVLFIRHAIPGEEVEVEITATTKNFIRADVTSVIEASVDRVEAPCPYAHREGCGGCDFQHISYQRQLQLKADIVREQFARIAKMDVDVTVEDIGPAIGWRTRLNAATDRNGALGFFGVRSNDVIPVKDCVVADQRIAFKTLASLKFPPLQKIAIDVSSEGERFVTGIDEPKFLQERVGDELLQVSPASFWQGHRRAPEVLTQCVKEMVNARLGDHILDLYGGVGLFASALIDLVGPGGRLDLVEGSPSATRDASKNFARFENVHIHTGDVGKILPRFSRCDLIVLDPPRDGAGRDVVEQMAKLSPRTIVYVACDPAALARDTAYLCDSGYKLVKVRVFDLFPMTQHIESVALFVANEVS